MYPEEFRRDAVALYRAADGTRTYATVAADLGISGETLRTWSVRTPLARRGLVIASVWVQKPRRRNWRGCGRKTSGCAVRRRNGSSNARSCAGQPRISPKR